MSEIYQESKKRLPSQKLLILKELREAGVNGVTNTKLTKIALRYGAPLGSLYQEGYKIDTINLGEGVVKYVLREEPKGNEKKKDKATDVLSNAMTHHFGEDMSEKFVELMDKLNITVKYKAGTFK